MLDIPCGDFHWMKEVDLHNIHYLGADIVVPLLEQNKRKYSSDRVQFRHLNLIEDEIPQVDLLLCRDCLVHFSVRDVVSALTNLCNSQSKFLLTTTFPKQLRNREIKTGQWAALNLEIEPFNLPPPLEIINEQCMEASGVFKDKSLGLWRISDLANRFHVGAHKND